MLASELPAWLARFVAFLFGATWGSFFNVAIHRWPREMSVVSPPSHCPACGAAIPAWRNVPIFAYLFQRGRAACCGARMTPRYVLVELASGVLAVALVERIVVRAHRGVLLSDVALEALLWFAFAGGLLIATFVDLEFMEIPDEVSIGGTALALATASWRPTVPIEEIVLGAGGAYLIVQLLLVWSWERLTGRRGMGEGDSKLAMFIGAFLGWRGALFALVAGSFQGIAGWAIARASGAQIGPSNPAALVPHGAPGNGPARSEHATRERDDAATRDECATTDDAAARDDAATTNDSATPHDPAIREDWGTRDDSAAREHDEDADSPSALERPIPFGPFLALGAIEFLFFGDPIVDWYLSLFE